MEQREIFMDALRNVAKLCAASAMTAPKSGGETRIAATRHLGVIQADLAVALSMSVSHKNIFFDKKMPEVCFDAPSEPPSVH